MWSSTVYDFLYTYFFGHLTRKESSPQIGSGGCVAAGTPGRSRTSNLLIRSQMLYPLSYGCLIPAFLAGRNLYR